MKLSELIKHLEGVMSKEGDLPVCVIETHEYWSTMYHHLEERYICVSDYTTPDGPKSGKNVRSVVIGKDF